MHEMLCFAGQNVPRKMDGEACPRGGCETVPAVLGTVSDRPRIVTDSSGFIWTTSSCWFLKQVFHKSFVFTSSTFTFGGRSRSKASFFTSSTFSL